MPNTASEAADPRIGQHLLFKPVGQKDRVEVVIYKPLEMGRKWEGWYFCREVENQGTVWLIQPDGLESVTGSIFGEDNSPC